ncbi:MAG: hypothetical protein RXR20_19745 [Paraburkholderia sp.]|jgi:hypothetical protein|uniref:hypothetical protein n=2 Tax=Burkholderiales TaxID=80840 RepID=UPI0010F78703|nr:hypothetical protein [Burkholderia sp. 4M9327F10]
MDASNRAKASVVAIVASVLFSGIIAWTFLGLVRYAIVAPPSFDGAMNLNTAASFLHGHGYGFFYDRFFPFPAQTDGPFILPAAIAFWLGGITPFTSQVVNLVYIAALVCVMVVLLRRVGAPLWLALFGVMVCVATPGFVEYSMNGYGEVPVMVWFLAALAVLASAESHKNLSHARLFSVGLLFGMAYLTKVVALVCVAPAMVVLGCTLLAQPNKFRRLGLLCAGFTMPVVAWEVFRLVEVGSVRDYVHWWRFQLAQIRAQSGANRTDAAEGFLRKGVHHLSILADLTGVAAPWLAIGIVVPIVVGVILARDRRRSANARLVLWTLVAVTGLYFYWWLFMSPTAMTWLRRILDGFLLLQCLIVAVLAAAWRRPSEGSEASVTRAKGARAAMLLALIPVIVCQLQLVRSGESVAHPPQSPGYALDMYRVADKVRALPQDATIFGSGWWQAPVVALFSQRQFMNIDHWPVSKINELGNKYFVTDMYAEGIDQSSIHAVLDRSAYQTLLKIDGGALYKLDTVQPYPPFTPEDSNPANLSSAIDFAREDYAHRRGIFQRESNRDAWVGVDAAVMLRRSNENVLRMTFEVPVELVKGIAPKQALLHLTSPGCLDQTLSLDNAGIWVVTLPLTCQAYPTVQPFKVNLTVDEHVPFVPQIDADNRLRSFKLRSMELVGTQGKS